jgi:DNA-binding HxlR family transcriptional regulator
MRSRSKSTPLNESEVSKDGYFSFRRFIAGKYTLRILWQLRYGALRFGTIRKRLNLQVPDAKQVAPRVLSRELKSMARLGLIRRKAYNEIPVKVEYSLTPLGQSWLPLISKMLSLAARSQTLDTQESAETRPTRINDTF